MVSLRIAEFVSTAAGVLLGALTAAWLAFLLSRSSIGIKLYRTVSLLGTGGVVAAVLHFAPLVVHWGFLGIAAGVTFIAFLAAFVRLPRGLFGDKKSPERVVFVEPRYTTSP